MKNNSNVRAGSVMHKNQMKITRSALVLLLMGLVLLAHAPAATALTYSPPPVIYHWLYISPGTCNTKDGVAYPDGSLESLSSSFFASCQVRLPQGATISSARVAMIGSLSTFSIQSISYANVLTTGPTSVVQWSGAGGNWYWSNAPKFGAVIDNENNSYVFNIAAGPGPTGIGLVEITYTMP